MFSHKFGKKLVMRTSQAICRS